MAGVLQGRTIVVTRPQAQAEGLAQAIADAGGSPLRFPLLEIAPAPNPAALQQAVATLSSFDLAIFISPNAVHYSLPALLAQGPWPAHLAAAAVGQGTLRALAAHGVGPCIAPTERFDSEALLALPALAAAAVGGKRIALLKGEGGRDLLAETLQDRGATVVPVPCYQRLGPPQGIEILLQAWQQHRLDAFTISSSEGLRHLVQLLPPAGREQLAETAVFVPHPRIAEQGKSLGLNRLILTDPADAGILASLITYPWPPQTPN